MLVIPTVLGVTMIIFIAMRLLPGDPLVAIFGLEGARRMTVEQRANLEQALGLRDPFVVQYGKWLRDIGTGDFGKSLLRETASPSSCCAAAPSRWRSPSSRR
jgi:ABC-type dipeptide/oligopeptide/nickel transport system permease component